jgi:hypothetical protein
MNTKRRDLLMQIGGFLVMLMGMIVIYTAYHVAKSRGWI